ncbi:MAG TPA: hypothetical protein VNU26_10400, partial [Mycobacteriales bacterium]|nr:hypothetical protein [Mycobacteriales bacterium]
MISDARWLLEPGTTRLQAETFASVAVGSATMSGDSGTRYVGQEAVQALVADASKRRSANSAAVVAAMTLVTDAPAVRSAWEEWARDVAADLPWLDEPAPPLQRAAVGGDPYDDHRVTLLDHGDHVIAVETSRALGRTVETVVMTDADAFGAWDADQLGELREVTAEEAVPPLLTALSHAEILWPPVEHEGYHTYRLLLEARLRATGLEPAEDELMSDEEERALLDR